MRFRLRTLLIILAIGPPVFALTWAVWQKFSGEVVPRSQWNDDYAAEQAALNIAQRKGWTDEYNRGEEMLRKLSRLSDSEREQINIAAYRDDKIALFCSSANGGINDLFAAEGFYVRVINASGKDLRPHAIVWSVLVYGKVVQVFPENKVIILEVKDKDWLVLQTM